jgi:hypothetical protein
MQRPPARAKAGHDETADVIHDGPSDSCVICICADIAHTGMIDFPIVDMKLYLAGPTEKASVNAIG